LDVSSRKRLQTDDSDDHPQGNAAINQCLDLSEARGLRQNIGKLLERRGIGEVVETSELWKCLFGNGEQNRLRQRAMKEVQRERIATAAESRRVSTIT